MTSTHRARQGSRPAANSNRCSTAAGGSPLYASPLVFNNTFWDNRAGTRVGDGVAAIGLTGDPFPIFHWDLGVSDRSANLAPTYSLLQVPSGSDDSTNLVGQDPLVVETHDGSVSLFAWRGNPNFVGADIVSVDLPVGEMVTTISRQARPRAMRVQPVKAASARPTRTTTASRGPSRGSTISAPMRSAVRSRPRQSCSVPQPVL